MRIRHVRQVETMLQLLAASATLGVNNGMARVPPLGWSTWQTCGDPSCGHDVCTEVEVLAAANALVSSGLAQRGFKYVVLDDCWVGANRSAATGELTWDSARFPSGIAHLAAAVHARNLSFGLYTSAGSTTCHSGPGSRYHYDLDATTFASWGVDYVKLDWCGDIKSELLLGAAAHRNFSLALNRTGRPMHLSVVAGYFFLGKAITGVANSWRFCEDHHDAWASTTEQLICRADLALARGASGPGSWADMDFATTGGAGCASSAHCPGQSDDEYRTEFAVWALTQSPLIVDTDVRAMTPIMRALLLNDDALALHQSTATPPGRYLGGGAQCRAVPGGAAVGGVGAPAAAGCTVWGRAARVDGAAWMVALLNSGAQNTTLRFDATLVGWPGDANFSVTDVWTGKALQRGVGGAWAGSVATHGAALLAVTLSP